MASPAAVSSTPIASRTCDAPTFPDEQAAPALTANPSRSKAITWVSPETPGMPMQLVFPRRGPSRAVEHRPFPGGPPCGRGAPPHRQARPPPRRSRQCRRHSPCRRAGRRSCAPRIGPSSARSRLSTSAPTPIGPPSLCAESASESASIAARSRRPAACTASQCPEAARLPHPAPDLRQRVDRSGFIVGGHERDGRARRNRVRADAPAAVHRQAGAVRMVQHGDMLARARQPFAPRQRERIRFRAAGGEHDLLRGRAGKGRNPRPAPPRRGAARRAPRHAPRRDCRARPSHLPWRRTPPEPAARWRSSPCKCGVLP